MGMAAILVMWPGLNVLTFLPLCLEAPYVKSFENVDGRRWTTEATILLTPMEPWAQES